MEKIAIGLVVFLFACIGIISSCSWLYHGIFPKGNSTKIESEILCEDTVSKCQDEYSDNQAEDEEYFSSEEIEYLKRMTFGFFPKWKTFQKI